MSNPERIIRLRLDEENLRRVEHGVHVSFFRLAEGVDGVHELYIEGHGKPPLEGGAEPLVPLKEDHDGD